MPDSSTSTPRPPRFCSASSRFIAVDTKKEEELIGPHRDDQGPRVKARLDKRCHQAGAAVTNAEMCARSIPHIFHDDWDYATPSTHTL